MKKNNVMRTIKNWLAFGVTLLLLVVLFAIIFITIDLAVPTVGFFLELLIVVCLSVTIRFFWYDFIEDKRLSEDDIKELEDGYFKLFDEVVEDTNDLDTFLVILNQENRDHFIKHAIGSRTAKNMAKKTKLMCLLHPSYKNLTEAQIGEIRYDKLYFKVLRKADKLRQMKSEELVALSDSEFLYDTKNHRKEKKKKYQTMSAILSTVFTIIIATLAFKEIALNWVNLFRYVTYLFSICSTIATTVIKAYRVTGDETKDWFNRLRFILGKYSCYKETQEVKTDGRLE